MQPTVDVAPDVLTRDLSLPCGAGLPARQPRLAPSLSLTKEAIEARQSPGRRCASYGRCDLHPVLTSPGVAFVIDESSGIPQLLTDPGKVAQILHNLVSSALRHTATGGVRVHPRLSDDGKSVAWVPACERLELRFLVGAGRQAVRLDLHPHRPRPRPSEGQRARAHARARARRLTTRTNGRAY